LTGQFCGAHVRCVLRDSFLCCTRTAVEVGTQMSWRIWMCDVSWPGWRRCHSAARLMSLLTYSLPLLLLPLLLLLCCYHCYYYLHILFNCLLFQKLFKVILNGQPVRRLAPDSAYVYIGVCVYMYCGVCTCVHWCVYMCVLWGVHRCTLMCVHVCTVGCARVYTDVCTCVYCWVCTCVHWCVYMCVLLGVHVCTLMCVHVCTLMCVH